ncbi:MAG TPA: hypothetical protein V6C76_10290 [Drouetiella sp.]
MIHDIGSFTINAFAVVFWAAVFATITAVTFAGIGRARLRGKTGGENDLSQLPVIGTGIVVGAIIGVCVSIGQLASASFVTNMFGFGAVYLVVGFVAVRVARRLYR